MSEAIPSVSPPPSGPQSGHRTGRGWRWLLVASLALNLLVAGAVAGLWIKGPPHGPPRWGPTPTTFGLMRFSRELPPERREKVRVHLREAFKAMRPLRDDMRTARRRAAEALGSTDFTIAQLKAAMDEIGSVETRMRQTGVEALINGIGELEAAERQKLGQLWLQRLDRENRRRGRRDKGGSDAQEPDREIRKDEVETP